MSAPRRSRIRRWLLLASPVLLSMPLAAVLDAWVGRERRAGGDLVVVTVDTLRADRLGAYGHDGARTPHFDALARSGVLFTAATAPMPRTTPALATMLSGLWPGHHGSVEVFSNWARGVSLAEVLAERGYATVAVSASQAAGPDQSFDRGFARFELMPRARALEVTAKTLELTETVPDTVPLFLWVHYVDPHFPYDPPTVPSNPEAPCSRLLARQADGELRWGDIYSDLGGIASRALVDCLRRYDAEIEFTDASVGALREHLAKRGRPTVVVLTADHGENFGEGGLFFEHGPNVHDASLRVPLIISGPGLAGGRVDPEPFRLEDLMPTLLSLLGVPRESWPPMDGADLSARLARWRRPGGPAAPTAFATSGDTLYVSLFASLFSGGVSEPRCLNAERYSWCRNDGEPPKLYDHVEDPWLTRDLRAERPALAASLADATEGWEGRSARERTARTGRFKLVETPRANGNFERRLYDLAADPHETRDVAALHPEVVARLGTELAAWLEASSAGPAPAPRAEDIEGLRALGYIE